MDADDVFMDRALALAARGHGRVSPNPMVGAVIVREGRIVGEGWHSALGGAHAEVEALRAARERARGGTMYVTLEPCNHHGRTPPCAPALLAAGLQRVVVAVGDPNPHVAGGGVGWLEANGVKVELGLREREALALNRAFFTWARRGRPFITLKAALTLDGKIACHTGHSQWITCEASRRRVHEERADHDAILVGVGTVLADDPRLDVRLGGAQRIPRPVVLDSMLRTPTTARLFKKVGPIIFTTSDAPEARRRFLQAAGAQVVTIEAGDDGMLSVPAVVAELGRRAVISLLVEGGGSVHASFLRHDCADRVLSFVAPLVLLGRNAPTPLGPPVARVPICRRTRDLAVVQCGDDLLIEVILSPQC